jgi:hypothetical protein
VAVRIEELQHSILVNVSHRHIRMRSVEQA